MDDEMKMIAADPKQQMVCRCLNIRVTTVPDSVVPPLPSPFFPSNNNNKLPGDLRLESQQLPEISIQSLKLTQNEAQDPFFATVVAADSSASMTSAVHITGISTTPVASLRDEKESILSTCRLFSLVPGAIGGCEHSQLVRNHVKEMLPVLVQHRDAGRFVVHACMICGQMGFAEGPHGQLLVNSGTLISDQSTIAALKQSPTYSPVFGVVLPKATELPPMIQTGTKLASLQFQNSFDSFSALPNGDHSQLIQAKVNDFLKQEQDAMEERIRQFIEAETKAFDTLKERVKEQRRTVMNLMLKNLELIDGCYYEDEVDSALPLSPYSLHSGDLSPNPTTVGEDGFSAAVSESLTSKGAQIHLNAGLNNGWSPRPKAFSNPTSMLRWNRKRHSGGSGHVRGLDLTAEEADDVFCFDMDDMAEFYNQSGSEEDAAFETDDSGHGGEEFDEKTYPKESSITQPHEIKKSTPVLEPQPKTCANVNFGPLGPLGTSLPVQIPVKTGGRVRTAFHFNLSSEDEKENEEEQNKQKRRKDDAAMAESFKELTLSVQPADHPDRLFGDRPARS